MQYFDPGADKYQRLGKVIGDLITASIMGALIIIFIVSMASR